MPVGIGYWFIRLNQNPWPLSGSSPCRGCHRMPPVAATDEQPYHNDTPASAPHPPALPPSATADAAQYGMPGNGIVTRKRPFCEPLPRPVMYNVRWSAPPKATFVTLWTPETVIVPSIVPVVGENT